ncbi:hypothetical protein BKA70DRAFT_1109250, partial [Coprinopsis sp. MPI-PUGE-AT-0042]
WAGEVISSRDKPAVSEEFQELEKDIELRKNGANWLLGAAEGYHHVLTKKVVCEPLEDSDKLLPIDALGIVMITHGEEFPHDSDFGASLVKFGRAHCKVATLQEAYALTFKDTFITAIENFRDEIKEYESLKKKLESRKVALGSANIRFDKLRGSKKDKDRLEAEEDLDRQQQRYDETSEDMRAHMHGIQDKEISHQKELTQFLDLEINFVQQYLDVLKEVRDEWPDKSSTHSRPKPHRNSVSKPRPIISSPIAISPSKPSSRSLDDSSESEVEDARPRRFSLKHRKSQSTGGSRPPSRPSSRTGSRPSSRLSRKRANSSAKSQDEERESPKETKDKETEDRPRRFSVAGWASNAVDSLTTLGSKSKDKESFSSLDDDAKAANAQEIEVGVPPSPASLKKSGSFSLTRKLSRRKKSGESVPTLSSPATPRILKPPSLQESKVVYATDDFKGSSEDELSFKAGTGIKVLNEVVEGWWMGEIDGQTGLFPTTHVSTIPPKPTLPARPQKNGKYIGLLSPPPPTATFPPGAQNDHQEGYVTSDLEEEYGYHQPMAHNRSPVYARFNDVASITSHEEEGSPKHQSFAPLPRRFSDDFDMFKDQTNKSKIAKILGTNTTPKVNTVDLDSDLEGHQGDTSKQPLISRAVSEGGQGSVRVAGGSPTKRVPPPPPPRRITTSTGVPTLRPTPVIPERKLGPAAMGSAAHGDAASIGTTSTNSTGNGSGIIGLVGCGKFRQNPFQPQGMCANCKQYHS